MKIINTVPGSPVVIGREGENLATQVRFDLTDWISLYGKGRAELIYQRPGDNTLYPVATEQDGNILIWTITATETANHGNYGMAELRYYVDEMIAKSAASQIKVLDALGVPEEIPDPPGQNWLEQAVAAKQGAEAAAVRSEESAVRSEQAAVEADGHRQAAEMFSDAAAASAINAFEIADEVIQVASEVNETAKQTETYKEAAAKYAEESADSANFAEMMYTGTRSDKEATEQLAAQAEQFAKSSKESSVKALQALDALLMFDSATGQVATTQNAAAMPIQALTVNDGTEVEAVKVIGKNFLNRHYDTPVSNIGVTVEWDAENQEFVINGTTTAPGDLRIVNPLHLDWVPGETYTVSVRQVGGTAVLAEGSGGTTYGWGIFQDNAAKYMRGSTGLKEFQPLYNFTAAAFALDANRSYIFYFQCWRPGTVFDNYRVKIQIEQGKAVTEWEPYRTSEAPISDVKALMLERGYNNIYTVPSADITVDYVVDTKMYIDSKFAELQDAILSTGGNV